MCYENKTECEELQKQNTVLCGLRKKWYILKLYCVTLRRLGLVPTCPKNRDFYDFPTCGILTTSGNTASRHPRHPRHPGHPRRSAIFTTWSEESEAFLLWRSIADGPQRQRFLRWVWTWNLPVYMGHRGCLSLSFLATKAWFSVNYRL